MEQKGLPYDEKSLNPVADLKRAMSLAIKASGLTRAEVADRMNEHIVVERLRTRGKDGLVTEAMDDKWLAPEDPTVIPLKLLKVFGTVMVKAEVAQEAAWPAQALVPEGYRVISPRDFLVLEFGRAKLEGKKIQRRTRSLAEQLEEMGQ